MKFILNDKIALRSWRRVPYAYYIKGRRYAVGLTAEQFSLLKLCDGEHDFETSELAQLEPLKTAGLIVPSKNGEKLTKWQRHKECDNRYFPAMSWMITAKCNFNCLHCFNAADNAPLMSEFSLQEALSLIEQAEECGINAITITGGEPMLHPHFFEIVQAIYDHGMYVYDLNTNGHFINDDSLKRLSAIDKNIRIKISFDGLTHHDWMRNRSGAEQETLAAIRACVAAGFRVQAQTNVHRYNLDTLLQTAELMDEIGVENMRIIRTTEAPRWVMNAGDATLDIGEYYDRMTEFLRQYIAKEHRMTVTIWQLAAVFPMQRAYRASPVECGEGEYRDSMPVCRGNRGMVAVDADGSVVPCHQMSGYLANKGIKFGNVKVEGLKPLLQYGSYLKEVCTTVGELKEANEDCRYCKYFRYCAGGCRAIALALSHDKFGTDISKCIFFKQGYYDKLIAAMGDWHNLAPINCD